MPLLKANQTLRGYELVRAGEVVARIRTAYFGATILEGDQRHRIRSRGFFSRICQLDEASGTRSTCSAKGRLDERFNLVIDATTYVMEATRELARSYAPVREFDVRDSSDESVGRVWLGGGYADLPEPFTLAQTAFLMWIAGLDRPGGE